MQAFVAPVKLHTSLKTPGKHSICSDRLQQRIGDETHRIGIKRRPSSPRRRVTLQCANTGKDDNSKSGRENEQEPLSFVELFLKAPVPGDKLVRTISASGEVSCQAINCTGLVRGVAQLFKSTPVVTTAFGRALTSSLLLASGKKGGETLQLEFRGSGPLNGMTVISTGSGSVRGFVGNPRVTLPLRNGQLDVPGAIGKGILAVVRSSPFSKTPYTGLVALSSGEVAEDIAKYLAESEQTNSALAAGVYIEPDGKVGAAAGFLVQLLPGASEKTIQTVERNVRMFGTPTEAARTGKSPEDVISELMKDLHPMSLASVSPRYQCQCGIDRVKRTVALLSASEVRDLLEKYGRIEATCEFCGQVYQLLRDEVEKLLAVKASREGVPDSEGGT